MIGLLVVVLGGLVGVTLVLGLGLAYLLYRLGILHKFRVFWIPQLLLLVLDTLYMPAKKLVSMLGGNDDIVDIIGIEIRNMLLREGFTQTLYTERVVIVPQCLRKADCPAKASPIDGIMCLQCGKCKIAEITRKARELGYMGVYTVTGGGFAKRLLKRLKPKAVVGVACAHELNTGMLYAASRGVPCQGILLLKDGCFETDTDFSQLYYQMELISEQK